MSTLTVAAAACSDDSGGLAKPKQQKVLEVGLDPNGNGACLMVDDTLPPEVDKLPVAACDAPHNYEVFATIPYDSGTQPADVYPGLSALNDFARTACFGAFEPYVGISAFDSKLVPTWLVPTLKGWNDKKDRTILCVLNDPTSDSVNASLRNSKI
jgi:hypothetical protein